MATTQPTSAPAPEFDAATQKWITYNNNRTGKIEKLQEENAKLKSEVTRLKASHSRIRRIPKKEKKAEEAEEPTASAA